MKESEFILAPHSGFCFGVGRAASLAEKAAAERLPGERLFLLEELIHNADYMRSLEEKGLIKISLNELEGVITSSAGYVRTSVIVRAHGIERGVMERLRAAESESGGKFRVIDGTCPDVARIHRIAERETKDGSPLIVIGDPAHPEVKGIMSWAGGPALAANTLADLESDLPSETIPVSSSPVVVAQTTQLLTEWKKCKNFIVHLYTKARIFDTICSVTEKIQSEADSLSREADLMVIIGDRSSSNTKKLYETAKRNCEKTFLVQGADAAAELHFPRGTKVGIAAGASTPGGIIEEVIRTMEDNQNITASEFEEKGQAAEENFEQLLNESLQDNTLTGGQTVNGIITSISPNELHVDLGTKVTGIIPISEITDDNGARLDEMFKVGDEIEAIVVKVSDIDGVATLSRKRVENILNWRRIVDAFNDKTTLEGKITEVVKSGVIINLDGVRVFIPASQSGVPRDGDLTALVGTTQRVKIIDLNEQRRRAVASIREVNREERKAKEAEFWTTIEKGKHYEGVVKSFMPYGAFVDLGGVDGMVHCSELSWKRVRHPSDVVTLGQTIDVYVKDFDPETHRISLGYKTEENNPWNIFIEKYSVGDTAHVKIVNLQPFGAFAEIVPGTDGLIHISQITTHMIANPSEVLTVGQEVDAKIIDIDTEKHKVSLSIKALLVDNANADEPKDAEASADEAPAEEASADEAPADAE